MWKSAGGNMTGLAGKMFLFQVPQLHPGISWMIFSTCAHTIMLGLCHLWAHTALNCSGTSKAWLPLERLRVSNRSSFFHLLLCYPCHCWQLLLWQHCHLCGGKSVGLDWHTNKMFSAGIVKLINIKTINQIIRSVMKLSKRVCSAVLFSVKSEGIHSFYSK